MDLTLEARTILTKARRGALATLMGDARDPYASLVSTVVGDDLMPLFLFSTLAQHAQNLSNDPRASLLLESDSVATAPDALAAGRVTLQGIIEPADKEALRGVYLAAHPEAEMYYQFTDFHLYRLNAPRLHFVAGFGRVVWLEMGMLL
ncbi:HugZ family pyridoxamine 5'-phosphate oxidase [Elstera litoralis]|uniref:HugZ family pyridoxamine 5'-phosphate oxidase n=1 Tax=Elstera litoralis TaxID=552518 RepID=UPI000696F647|nr:pyridoxamine 5'-phosphate oxidase family protein [Elstera litoralis]